LLVTFFLGLGLGFSLCYAMLEVLGSDVPSPGELPGTTVQTPTSTPPAVTPSPDTTHTAQANTPGLTPAPGDPLPDGASAHALPEIPGWSAANLVIALTEVPDEAAFSMLAHFAPAGVVLPDAVFDTPGLVTPLCARLREGISPPPVVLARLEAAAASLAGGVSLRELGEGPVEQAQATAELWGRALRALGIDAVLGPRLDAYQGGPVPPEATFGADTDAILAHGAAVIAGLRAGGVAPIAVGYPGEASAVHNEGMPVLGDAGNINALVDVMAPFAAAIQEGVPAMLVAHVAVPAIEMGSPPPPASFSRKLVYQLLRERRNYAGAILSDDVAALPVAVSVGPGVAAVAALAAGCDIVILGASEPVTIAQVCLAIAATVEEGLLTREGLEESAARLAALTEGLPPLLPMLPEEPIQTGEPAAPEVTEDSTMEEAASADGPDTHQGPPPGTSALTHPVARGETLTGIAGRYGVTVAQIRAWNGLPADEMLKYGQELQIHVPESEAAAHDGAPVEPPATPAPLAPPTPPAASAGGVPDQPPGTRHEAVVFGEADTLEGIAQRYGVTVTNIRDWNGLQGSAPTVGDVLHLFPAREGAATSPEPSPPAEPEGNFATHVIAVGDTLHSIAMAHGTTVQELVRINSLSDPNKVKLGQRLKIPARE
jgi:LysM repeat protein